jgi:catechol 2,3-dioxygenase-like lactoylglutathione lyase family enzyme
MAIEVRGMAPLLEVFDMPASVAFYCEVLGFTIVTSDGKTPPNFDWVLLELGGVQLMLNTAYESGKRPPEPSKSRMTAHHDVCLYFGCPDVDAAYEHLRARGMQVKPPHVEYYGMKQLYISDPDNYNLCFQWPEKMRDGKIEG